MQSKQRGRFWRVDSVPLDRGKRHYWNTNRRDYGVCESSNSYQNYQNQQQSQLPCRRYSTIQNHTLRQSIQESRDWKSTQKSKKLQNNKLGKSDLHLVNSNIQIHLPSIKQNQSMLNPQSSQKPQRYEQQNNSPIKRQKNPQRNTNSNLSQVPNRSQNKIYPNQRVARIRYSPTYVCSTNNPLPTFKIYSKNLTKPIYQYGFAEQNY